MLISEEKYKMVLRAKITLGKEPSDLPFSVKINSVNVQKTTVSAQNCANSTSDIDLIPPEGHKFFKSGRRNVTASLGVTHMAYTRRCR